ncbi:MAG: Mov34/MPN/PAD-1 family protein [Anaerolineae bacterium]|jgi:proteasome lid subunit RPN8/RPN11|nr:Mov34/MPN/PAD-1 family protein [Anaerolineae bacterium]MCZ7551825.1 Mov34/MPN/PAD-1 family protein [Anaerolineales bacterium]
MSDPSIRLLPADPTRPRRAHIPCERAWRWRSLVEDDRLTPGVTVFVTQRAYVRICAHAGSDLYNEVGGWLVGKWRADRSTNVPFIVVEAILPAPHTRHGSAYLTFTQDTQVSLYDELKERYPNKELVGWYHTHPRMGIFLSEYDVWLHHNFFPEPYHVALVVEPHSTTAGFFIRQHDGTLDSRYYFGFHELHHRNRRSVVHWRNMFPQTSLA